MNELTERNKYHIENALIEIKSLPGKLKPEVKEEWIKALLSGEFKQARTVLHAVDYTTKDDNKNFKDSFCCLGVLCKINNLEETVKSFSSIDPDLVGYFCFNNDSSDTFLPNNFVERLILISDDEYTDEDLSSKIDHLAQLNDSGYTFEQIAAVIETYF